MISDFLHTIYVSNCAAGLEATIEDGLLYIPAGMFVLHLLLGCE